MKEADCVRLFAIAFSKVFDSVSQAIIFNKLKEVSINPYIIYWIIFFPRWLQRLVSNGTMSSFWSIIRGVPQGPVYLNWVVRIELFWDQFIWIELYDISPVNSMKSMPTI